MGMEDFSQLLSTLDVARRLGVAPVTIRTWANAGNLRVHRVTQGGHRRYLLGDVVSFMERRRRQLVLSHMGNHVSMRVDPES